MNGMMRSTLQLVQAALALHLLGWSCCGRASAFSAGSTLPLARGPRSTLSGSRAARSQLQPAAAVLEGVASASGACAGDGEPQVAAVAGACASLLIGTIGGTKMVNAARDALAAARLVSPEGWRQAIETLPVILGLCYAGIGLLHWTEADVLVSTATILWSFCDQSISQAVGAAEVMGALGMLLGQARTTMENVLGIEVNVSGPVRWLTPLAAAFLLLLTAAITPANIYIYTHGGAADRFGLQALLLCLLVTTVRDTFFYTWGDQVE